MSDRFTEIDVERLLLREPNNGRVRAGLECGPPRDQDTEVKVPTVRLTLMTPTGEPALVAEVDETGAPTVFVGNPDRGSAVAVTPIAVDLWSGGNIVASVRATEHGGRLELMKPDGTSRLKLPDG